MEKKDLKTLADLSKSEIFDLIERGKMLKQWKSQGICHKPLEGKTLGLIFNKPSTRTRVTFEVGMYQLGGMALFLSEKEIQLGRGETVADTAKVLSRYLDGVVMRTFKQKDIDEFAAESSFPIINGLTDSFHPCQVLADIMTIEENMNRIEGVNLVYVGDFNNVANSLILGALRMGFKTIVACPEECKESDDLKEKIEIVSADGAPGSYEVINDPFEAVKDADIIYSDVWISMGQESEREEKLKLFSPYQVNSGLIAKSRESVKIMHCLPAHRGEEITSEVLESEKSIVFDQAENRLHIQKAILEYLL